MIHIRDFTGEFPTTPAQSLPENAAQYALDCDVGNGELSGVFSAQNVFHELPKKTKGVFTPDGYHIISSLSPMKAYTGPTVDDIFDRVYFTNDDGLRVSRWTDAGPTGALVDSWKVGVPAPLSTISVEKVRKNRWPSYPNTKLKAKFYLEAAGLRYGDKEVVLTKKDDAAMFSAYTFDSGINVVKDNEEAKKAAETKTVKVGDIAQIISIFCTSDTTFSTPDGTVINFKTGWNSAIYSVEVFPASIALIIPYMIPAPMVEYGSSYATAGTSSWTIPKEIGTKVILASGVEAVIDYTGELTVTREATAAPADSNVCVEVWLENLDKKDERIWTIYTGLSLSAGSVNSFPGGASVTLSATGDTTYEINISYGVVEDRAYIYTMFNDWNEESQPSEPSVVATTFVDDVILRVDYDACAKQLEGYRPLDHIQFYCASDNGKYIAINTAPSGSGSVTDLYHRLFWREPDAEGLAFWTAQYNSGVSLSDIAARMEAMKERINYENYLIVEDLYFELLGRESDDEGFNYWRNRLEAGESLQTILVDFLYAANSFVTHPVPANINWYYTTFMERNADAKGLAYWTEKTTEDRYELANMLYIMLKSKEYADLNKVRHITQILTLILGRTPTSGEVAAGVAKNDSGQDYNALATIANTVVGDGFIDEGTNRAKGWTLPSLDWTCPHPDLKMLTMLPNGVFAAVRDNYVYFSEPYMPHAWPLIYGQSVPFNVVGAMAYEGQLLLTTTSSPFVISGTHPGGMTQQRIGAREAGANEHAMTIVAGRPVYASRDGLVMINGTTGSLDMSRKFWSAEKWRSTYGNRIDGIRMMAQDNKLIALFESGDGFIISIDNSQPHVTEFSQESGYQFTVPGENAIYLTTGKTPASEYTNYDNYLMVEGFYVDLLDKTPDKPGFNYWRNRLESSENSADVIFDFLYVAKSLVDHPVPANINWYYQAFMGRNTDAVGLAYWTAAITKDQKKVAEMIYAMMASKEYADLNKTRIVKQLIETDLGRSATAGEIAAGVVLYNEDRPYFEIAALSGARSSSKKLFFGSRKNYVWKSKEFTMPFPTTFSAVKVVGTGDAKLTFYGDGGAFHTANISSVTRQDHYLRLPGFVRYSRFSVQIEGGATIIELHIAKSMGELANG